MANAPLAGLDEGRHRRSSGDGCKGVGATECTSALSGQHEATDCTAALRLGDGLSLHCDKARGELAAGAMWTDAVDDGSSMGAFEVAADVDRIGFSNAAAAATAADVHRHLAENAAHVKGGGKCRGARKSPFITCGGCGRKFRVNWNGRDGSWQGCSLRLSSNHSCPVWIELFERRRRIATECHTLPHDAQLLLFTAAA